MTNLKCKICNKNHKSVRRMGFHISRIHKIKMKSYYDKYYKLKDDGICLVCNNETTFYGFGKGYAKHCSYKCSGKNTNTHILRKKYNNKKYGVDNVSQLDFIKLKKEKTCLKHFGFKTKLQDKTSMKKSVFNKFGVDNVSKLDSVKKQKAETFSKNYHSHKQLKILYQKKQNTCFKNSGVYHPMHIKNIKDKVFANKNHLYPIKEYLTIFGDKISYQSTYELNFIKYCEQNKFKILNGDIIPYVHNSINHLYYIDFKIYENKKWRLVEIKGKHKWFHEELKNGTLIKKIISAIKHTKKNKFLPFKFILNKKEFSFTSINKKFIYEKLND